MAEVLVIEDDESMNDILVRSLNGMGHRACSAFNAEQALGMCLSRSFSLIVTDVILPGQDGIECLGQIKSMQADVHCIVITGYARKEIPERAILLKVDDYLLKPFSMQSFLTAVTQVLDLENARAQRQALLDRLLPSTSVNSCEEVSDMVGRRRDTIRALYVGARSRLLTRKTAKTAYLGIEAAEETFRKLLMRKAPDLDRVQKVRAHYAKIYQGIVYPRAETPAEQVEMETTMTSDQFARLHDNVLSSAVGLHDLEYAPLLRRIADSRLQHFPELLELKHHLWQ